MLIHVKGKAVKLESIECGNWTQAMVITRIVQRDCQKSNIWYFSAFFFFLIKMKLIWNRLVPASKDTLHEPCIYLMELKQCWRIIICYCHSFYWYLNSMELLTLNFLIFPHRFMMVMMWSRWKVCPSSLVR